MTSYHLPGQEHQERLISLFIELESTLVLNKKKLAQIVKKYPKSPGKLFTKFELISAYRNLAGAHGLEEQQPQIMRWLRKKPIRTSSGVAPVTVLTKPFPCPGKCIFCPSDIRMPKSYLADEPGAQRAERNYFDPYLQTYNRLQALDEIGHNVDKAELIILGGTWSYYPEQYQIWFIKECFRAMNEFGKTDDRPEIIKRYRSSYEQLKKEKLPALSDDPKENEHALAAKSIDGTTKDSSYNRLISEIYNKSEEAVGLDKVQQASWAELAKEQKINETTGSRCVGLVIETRPDHISKAEVVRIRKLGCTKAQIGFQSLDDEVLKKNKRGHTVAQTRKAVNLLRQAGFKIHAHWMANLYGSTVEKDKADFAKMFSDPDFKPDELKIYPCSLIKTAQLMQYFEDGRWQPYTKDELLEVLKFCFLETSEYCRLTRVIRDIPSPNIVDGNKITNFRQLVEQALEKEGKGSKDIRAREIRGQSFDPEKIKYRVTKYPTSVGQEVFLQAVVELEKQERLLGFLRLSLPKEKSFIKELASSAVIREVHVYGRVTSLGDKDKGKAQHLGIGKELIARAKKLAHKEEHKKLSVISAVGTREYYRKLGFEDGEMYQHIRLI